MSPTFLERRADLGTDNICQSVTRIAGHGARTRRTYVKPDNGILEVIHFIQQVANSLHGLAQRLLIYPYRPEPLFDTRVAVVLNFQEFICLSKFKRASLSSN